MEQLIWNCIISGLMLALIAVGFSLIFNVLKVFHIAHGAVYVSGGYFYLWINFILQQNILISILLTVIFVIFLAILIEKLVYKPLANRNSGQAITLISSMGIYILLINLIAVLFGNESRISESTLAASYDFYNIVISHIQLVQFIVTFVALIMIFGFSKSKYFLKVKAVISNQKVASVIGVNSNYIRLFAICFGSMIAVIVSILKLYDTGINPYSGMSLTLSAAVVVILGGIYSFGGTIIASLILSVIQSFTEYFISAQWKEGITFLILVIIILWKTEGIVNFKLRLEEK